MRRPPLFTFLVLLPLLPLPAQGHRTRNVIVVTLDGMRWQEIFAGADSALLFGGMAGVTDTAATARRFWRATPRERREALLPFFWHTLAAQGQVFGDSVRGSTVAGENGFWFSYPGYNELLTGRPDPRISSNDKVLNPNATVLEWLNGLPAYHGRVIAWGSWDVLPFILDTARSGLPANAVNPPYPAPADTEERLIDRMADRLPVPWDDGRLDAVAMAAARHDLRVRHPRVLYVMLGETDNWGHDRRYDLYLDAARRSDAFLEEIWTAAQALPQYQGTTSLIVATDHGRGAGPSEWLNHDYLPEARRIWMAVLGPDTPPLGVRSASASQGQLASTVAALLGEDFAAARPGTPPPLPGAVRR